MLNEKCLTKFGSEFIRLETNYSIMNHFLLGLAFTLVVYSGFSQKNKTVTVFGSLSFSTGFYQNNSSFAPNKQSPFFYSVSGSATIRVKNFSLPFSFTYSDQKFSHSNPFLRMGISPRYKWITAHIGYSSINYSSLILGGRQFLGVGIELSPNKFYFSVLYGKYDNLMSRPYNMATYSSPPIKAFDRYVYGGKIGYGDKTRLDLMVVKVKDDENSIPLEISKESGFLPEDNMVVGINFKTQINNRIFFDMSTAGSLHTANINSDIDIETNDDFKQVQGLNKFVTLNYSTRWGYAGEMNLKYKNKLFQIGAKYKRVEPNYRALGVDYMRTDYENYTLNFRTKLFKKRLRIKLKGGFQRNNLDLTRKATSLRKIARVNLNYNYKGFMAGINYNNTQSDQKAGYVELEDTLRLAVANNSTFVMVGYRWKKKSLRYNVNLNLGKTNFKELNSAYFVTVDNNTNNTFNVNFQLTHIPSTTTFSLGTNYYILESAGRKRVGNGINFGVGKKVFKKKIQIRFTTVITKRSVDGTDAGYSLRLRNNLSYNITKKQSFNFYISWAKSLNAKINLQDETRANLSYRINF